MQDTVVVGLAGLISSGVFATLGYRLGKRGHKLAEQRHHDERQPRFAIRSHRMNSPAGPPHVALLMEAGPDLSEIELAVLPPLAGSKSAGQLMETGRGTPVPAMTVPGPLRPGAEVVVRVALHEVDRGTDLRLRVTSRASHPSPWWHLRGRPDEEWSEAATVAFPQPASTYSPVGHIRPRPGRR